MKSTKQSKYEEKNVSHILKIEGKISKKIALEKQFNYLLILLILIFVGINICRD